MRNDKVVLTTMVIVVDKKNNKILMQKRKKSWLGYAPPGGHVEDFESLVECAIREVKEETGIDVLNLKFNSITHFVKSDGRYIVFNYYTEDFYGELIEENLEGEPLWLDIEKLDEYELSDGLKERFERMFFDKNIVEAHITFDELGQEIKKFYDV